MKRLLGIVFSVFLFSFPFAATPAQTIIAGPADTQQSDDNPTLDTSNEISELNLDNQIVAYNEDDNDDEYSDDEYSDSDSDQYYFDNAFKKFAYNTPEYRGPTRKSTFVFDPNKHRWFAYNRSGELVGSGRASGGKGYCPDIHRRCKTPAGTFRIYSMGGPGCVSTKFPIGKGGAPMPYCMFFHGGYAIHGSYQVPNYNASHGCIRVEPAAAKWLQQNVLEYGSTVIVRPY